MSGGLDSKVRKLFGEIEDSADADKPFENVKKDVDKVDIKEVYDGKPAKGAETEEKLNKTAESYLKALGWRLGKEAEYYGHQMKQWLGDDLGKAEEAIKQGNAAKLHDLFQDAYVKGTHTAKVVSILSKIGKSDAPIREKLYKLIAKSLGGDDYLKVSENTQGAVMDLTKYKAEQKRYKTGTK